MPQLSAAGSGKISIMMDIELEGILSLPVKKILFVGIGNVLKSDDGVGVYICRNLKNRKKILSLTAEVSIENYIGKINKINSDLLVIIDCVDMNSNPGFYKVFKADQIADMTFNTHNISLNRLSEFFKMKIFILGIQPDNVNFGETLTDSVLKSANEIISIINKD